VVRKALKRHGAVLAGYGAAIAAHLGGVLGGLFLPLGVALAALLALKGAGLSGGRPFLALAPGGLAYLGTAFLPEAPGLAGLAAALAVGLALEAAPLLAREEGAEARRVA
jgi:hypothetical protein